MKYAAILICILFGTSAFAAGEFITYSVDGQEYEGYFINPGGDAPLTVMVHDWDGLTDYEVKRAEMLAELGYAVFAVDLFGKGVRPTETEEKRKLTGSLYGDREKMRTLLNAGLAEAVALTGGSDEVVAFGYCFGGAAVLELARSGADLDGFVTFHGGLTTPEGQDYSGVKGSVLVLHGTADTSVTMEDFASLATQLEGASVPHEMITYSGAPHAFTVFGSPRYREDADQKSWARFTQYLRETM